MKKFINKAMLTLVVFGLAIVSSFGMETDPPTEPVKTTVETDVVANNLEKPTLIEEAYGYQDASGNCIVEFEGDLPLDCSPMNNGPICTKTVGTTVYDLILLTRTNSSHPWECTTTKIKKTL